jgi:diadenosine tetraphosphate (Ap4A) HIT family hydrolase
VDERLTTRGAMSARVRFVSDPNALPSFTSWPSFPFDGDLRIKPIDAPVAVEPPRQGEDPADCQACTAGDEAYVWVSERWRVRSLERPSALPAILILEPRSHLDLGDLPNLLAAELGIMTVRVERAARSLDGVARVHVNRWGDGAAHLHVWFLARPYGQLQLQGSFLSMWDHILPPISQERWLENLAHVAALLADFGGRAIAEPPRIQWQSPARFATEPSTEATPPDTTDAPTSTPAQRSGSEFGADPGIARGAASGGGLAAE